MPITTFKLVLKSAKMLAPSIRHLSFQREDGENFSFVPGQFVTFYIPHGEKILKRSYSISTIPDKSNEIEIAASYVPEGVATHLLSSLQIGDSIAAAGPFGRLVLREEKIGRYILVATGTGISPYRSMIPQLLKRLLHEKLEVIVLLGVRGPDELLYGEDFIAATEQHPRFKFYACYSRRQPEIHMSYEKAGRVVAMFPELNVDPHTDIVYLCGNPDMIDNSFDYLKTQHFTQDQVRREKYISNG